MVIVISPRFIGLTKYPCRYIIWPEGKEHFQEGFAKANVPGIPELVEMAQEMGVSFIGCQMTMDVMGLDKEAFVDGIEVGGAVTFLEFANFLIHLNISK